MPSAPARTFPRRMDRFRRCRLRSPPEGMPGARGPDRTEREGRSAPYTDRRPGRQRSRTGRRRAHGTEAREVRPRSKLAAAAAASGPPSWKRTPSRSVNVHAAPSLVISHDDARAGTIRDVPGSTLTSVSKSWRVRDERRRSGSPGIERGDLGQDGDAERATGLRPGGARRRRLAGEPNTNARARTGTRGTRPSAS
jgi:hypothetical protein